MTRRAPKLKRKNTNTSGKDASPRGGMKTKQTKVSNDEGTGPTGPKQTKLSFAPTPTANNGGTPTAKPQVETTVAITPEGVARLPPGNPSATESSNTESTSKKNKKPKKNKNTTQDTNNTAPITTIDSGDDAKPAAKIDRTPKPKTNPFNKPKYKEIRYRGIIDVPPSTKPFKEFYTLLKKYLETVQTTISKSVYLAPWDKEQEATFPVIKTKEDIPESREALGIYLGNYINPKEDGGKVWMNLRWVISTKPPIPLEKFGMELADALPRFNMMMNKQPYPCQAVKSACIGWFMYSAKQINSKTFIAETRDSLNIPPEVPIGISYRAILNEIGRKPPFNKEDPSPAAIHLDIDERFYMVYQMHAASLWRKKSKKRLPNGVQLRLVPCFSSPIGKSMTDEVRADAITLAERQGFFVKQHIRPIDYHFISLLDTPIANDNPMTLRRAMMSRAPKDRPASRLIHNVDPSWNSTTKYVVTTVVGREEETHRFLANLIPELLHVHGPGAAKWFTSQGLTVYQHVRWNPKKGTTTSAHAKESAALVKEDLWDLSEKWKTLTGKAGATKDARPDATKLDEPNQIHYVSNPPTKPPTEPTIIERMAGDKSIASFGNAFGRDDDSDDVRAAATLAAETAANPPPEITGAKFLFSPEQVSREHEKANQNYESDGKSMSTAGKTTDSTRLNLKIALEKIADLEIALIKRAQEEQQVNAMETEDEPPKPPDKMETDQSSSASSEKEADSSLEEEEEIVFSPAKVSFRAARTTDEYPDDDFDAIFKEAEKEASPTPCQLIGSALNAKQQESITAESDAMEDDDHETVYVGDLPPLPASDSSSASNLDPSTDASSSSSSSSSSSDGSHDTQELVDKLTQNQYHALSNHKSPKKSTKTDAPSDSPDFAGHPYSGQNSGNAVDHHHAAPLDDASDTQVLAGSGD
jgi:hypothetical protein